VSSIHFPFRPRVDDLRAAITVQKNLDYLAQIVTDLVNSQDWGSVVVINGTTSISVDFAVSMVNAKVSLTPAQNMAGVDYWVSNIVPTGFRVNVSTAAPTAGYGFDWIARGGT